VDTGEPDVSLREQDERLVVRRLPRTFQFTVVGVVAALMFAALMIAPILHPLIAPRSAPAVEAVTETGRFKPTAQQWTSLAFAPIETRPFRDAQQTDGIIAIDDDLTTPVISPYSGRVTKLFAKAGDDVAQGTPLFAVAASEFVQAQNDLISAAATMRTARAQLNLAQTNEKRQHDLYLAQGGALKDWQQSQVDLANAQGSFATAQIAVTAVRNRLRILGKTDSEIQAIEVAPELLKLEPDAVVGAPIGGTIISRQIGLGQNIVSAANGSSTTAFQIGDLSKVWLVANAREADAPFLHVGDAVEVRVLAIPTRVFKARVFYIGAQIDPTTHRLAVRAEVENPDRSLKPQMFASFTIITSADSAAPAVPEDAVVYEGDSARVWVAHNDKTLELRAISPGRSADGMIEVLKGLRAGESVVTSGSVFIDRAAKGS
jgi:cobalt-zinc-cadmium efflux system membrane fusion protein